MRTLLGFVSGFDLLDSFLEFFLKGFPEKLSSFVEKEELHVVEELWVAGDEVAFIEEGFEFGDEEFVGRNGEGGGLHGNYVLVKVTDPHSLKNQQKTLAHPSPLDYTLYEGGTAPLF